MHAKSYKRDNELKELRLRLKDISEKKEQLDTHLRLLSNNFGKTPSDFKKILENVQCLNQENVLLAKKLREVRAAQLDVEKQLMEMRREKKELQDRSKQLTERDAKLPNNSVDLRNHRQSLGPIRPPQLGKQLLTSSNGRPINIAVSSTLLTRTNHSNSLYRRPDERTTERKNSEDSIETDQAKDLNMERELMREKAQLESIITKRNKEIERLQEKLQEYERQQSANRNAFKRGMHEVKEEKEDSLLVGDQVCESIAETAGIISQVKKGQGYAAVSSTD